MLPLALSILTSFLLALSASEFPLSAAAAPVTKHVYSTAAIEPRADAESTGWYYDPAHSKDAQFRGLVVPEAGKCNLLLSVLKKGENVSP
jgi:hypothetical protein